MKIKIKNVSEMLLNTFSLILNIVSISDMECYLFQHPTYHWYINKYIIEKLNIIYKHLDTELNSEDEFIKDLKLFTSNMHLLGLFYNVHRFSEKERHGKNLILTNYAIENGHFHILEFLYKRDIKIKPNKSSINLAVRRGHFDVLKLLIQNDQTLCINGTTLKKLNKYGMYDMMYFLRDYYVKEKNISM